MMEGVTPKKEIIGMDKEAEELLTKELRTAKNNSPQQPKYLKVL